MLSKLSHTTEDAIFEAINKGRAVYFLGAGINLAERPSMPPSGWIPNAGLGFPNGRELSEYLVLQSGSRVEVDNADLIKVSQFFETTRGRAYITDIISSIFSGETIDNHAYSFLAKCCLFGAKKGFKPIFITTNYDHSLENSFNNAEIDFDTYILEATSRQNGPIKLYKNNNLLIEPKNSAYLKPSIIKIHGHTKYTDNDPDCYIISEDDYIRFLATVNPFSIFPSELCAKLAQSHYLFMGYSLRDWNMRVFMYKLWDGEIPNYNSWSVQHQITNFESQLWMKKHIELIEVELYDFCKIIENRLAGVSL